MFGQAVRNEAPAALPSGYADDTGASSTQASPIQHVLDITGDLATVTGQTLNASKSHVWSESAEWQYELQSMQVLGDKVPATRGGRLLGAMLLIVKISATK